MIWGKKNTCLAAIILFTSCSNFSEIYVGEVREFTVKGFEDNALVVTAAIPVTNPTLYKIRITEIDLKVYMNNQYLGKIHSIEQLVLPAKSDETYNMDLNVRVVNLFGAALTMINLKKGQKINFRMEGTITARSVLVKKRIEIHEERIVVI
ncbi:hypothetical protein ES705_14637 [subsurface metagenome]